MRIGAMTQAQVDEVLRKQELGDKRRFGDIALELGYVHDDSIKHYVDYLETQK